MANEITKKEYLSKVGLEHYDAKIKSYIDAADAEQLAAAKKYTDEAPFDPAGTAEAKVKALAEGQVQGNTDAIAAINNETTGILAKAKEYADGKDSAIDEAKAAADAAQADVDALVDETEGSKGRIPVLEGKVEALIAGTYDDTEVRGLIQGNTDAIDDVNERVDAIVNDGGLIPALDGRVEAVEGQVETLIGTDANKSVRTIANEELAKQLIAENAAESLNELQEISAWIQEHPGDAAAMNKAIEDLEALVGTLPTGITATTVVGYIQEIVAAEKSRAEGVEGGLDDRLKVVEGQLGSGENNVDARIATAKQEAIDAAAGDATTKAGQALTDAKAYTDTEVGKVTATAGANGEAITALQGRADALEGRADALETSLAAGGATANAIAAAQQAGDDAQADVDALVADGGRIPTLESKVAALESVEYVEITTSYIDTLFE